MTYYFIPLCKTSFYFSIFRYVFIMYHNPTLRKYFDKSSTYTPLSEKNNGVNGQYGIDIAEIGRTSSKTFNHDASRQVSYNSSTVGGSQSAGISGKSSDISNGGSFSKLETQASIKFKRNRSNSFSNKYK
jgi:hypothetical protein